MNAEERKELANNIARDFKSILRDKTVRQNARHFSKASGHLSSRDLESHFTR
jgi:hypothetical protein